MSKIHVSNALRTGLLAGLVFFAAACNAPSQSTTAHVDTNAAYDAGKAKTAGARSVTKNFAVAPQIRVRDVQALADAGFTRIINHLPDAKEGASSQSAKIAAEAKRLGLKFVNLPFYSGNVTKQAFDGISQEWETSNEPTLSYCRSGTRAITIWAMAQVRAGNMTPDQVIDAAKGAGYRLQGQKATFEALVPKNAQ